MRQGAYPSTQTSASVFYEEAIRHLTDARVLLDNSRYAAAIASAHKAQELAVKAALILENAMGIYDKLFNTHKPLEDITGIKPLSHLNEDIDAIRGGLKSDASDLEKLEAAKNNVNSEYPFHSDKITGLYTVGDPVTWVSPATHFTENDANQYYNVAREVVFAIGSLYVPDLRAGAEPIPDAA